MLRKVKDLASRCFSYSAVTHKVAVVLVCALLLACIGPSLPNPSSPFPHVARLEGHGLGKWYGVCLLPDSIAWNTVFCPALLGWLQCLQTQLECTAIIPLVVPSGLLAGSLSPALVFSRPMGRVPV